VVPRSGSLVIFEAIEKEVCRAMSLYDPPGRHIEGRGTEFGSIEPAA